MTMTRRPTRGGRYNYTTRVCGRTIPRATSVPQMTIVAITHTCPSAITKSTSRSLLPINKSSHQTHPLTQLVPSSSSGSPVSLNDFNYVRIFSFANTSPPMRKPMSNHPHSPTITTTQTPSLTPATRAQPPPHQTSPTQYTNAPSSNPQKLPQLPLL